MALVLVPGLAIFGQYAILQWQFRMEPDGAELLSLARQREQVSDLEATLQKAQAEAGLARTVSLDEVRETMDDLSRGYVALTAPSSGVADSKRVYGWLTSQGFDRAHLASLVGRIESEPDNKPLVSQALEDMARIKTSLNRCISVQNEVYHARRNEALAEQVATVFAGTSVILILGFLMSKWHLSTLRAALRRATETNEVLRLRSERLVEIQGSLNAAQSMNEQYKLRLAKALDEAHSVNEVLHHASHRLQELFSGLPVACITTDTEGSIFEWNRAASQLFQLGAEALYLQSAADTLPIPEDRAAFADALRTVGDGGSVHDLEWRARLPQDEIVEILSMALPIRALKGEVTGILVTCFDQTERQRAAKTLAEKVEIIQQMNAELESNKTELEAVNARLQLLATTDGLTGLLNHRAFQQALQREFLESQSSAQPFSVLLLDVDNFKDFNDTYGHQAGDEVLKSVAHVLRANAGPEDVVARYGGEEFVVLCPKTGAREASRLAETLRSAIERATWDQRPVTASIGVHTRNKSTSDPAEMVALADAALYQSKHRGRNCVTFSSDPEVAAA